jgi:hypothetical protein
MAVMHDQGPTPGERRLERPPSERYAAADDAAPTGRPGSFAQAVALGSIAAGAGAVLTVLLGGVVALSAGLLVVAASAGYGVGVLTRLGGGTSLAPTRRTSIAIVLALVGFSLGQLGLWWYAGT